MSAAVATTPDRAQVNAWNIALIRAAALSLGVFLSGFVLNEPAPYELYMAGLIAVWALFGLRISRSTAMLAVMLVAFNLGGLLALTQMSALGTAPLYVAVSLFLAATAIFVAAILEAHPELFRVIFRAWVAAGLLTSTLGILGYFNVFPGAEAFTRYGRAAGAFEDPNVFGPFLALPALYLLHRLLTGRASSMMVNAAPLLVVVGGIFFSFSRGAWALFAVAALLLVLALFLRSQSGLFRLRIVLLSLAAVALLGLALIVALQIPAVSDLFLARAQLVQDYDGSRLGRFARYGLGFQLAMERPLGIGPLVFGKLFGEDTHNIWLKALMDYGWLGFAAFLALVGTTLAAGFRILLRDRPWQPYLLCAYLVFATHIALGTVIDTDHWRHFYLLIGLIWGAIGLEIRWQRGSEPRSAAKQSRSPAPQLP